MLRNKYTDTSVQKEDIPWFSGYVEQTSAMTQLLQEARINHKDLTVVWLDLANAYGSTPPQTNTSGYASVLHSRPFKVTSLWITSIKTIWDSQAADSQPPASKRYCHRDGSSLSNCWSWFRHEYQGSKKRHQGKHWNLSAIQGGLLTTWQSPQ